MTFCSWGEWLGAILCAVSVVSCCAVSAKCSICSFLVNRVVVQTARMKLTWRPGAVEGSCSGTGPVS
jgi:hypothetical protein